MKANNFFDQKVKSVVIVHRPDSKEAIKDAKNLATWFTKKKVKVFSHPDRPIQKNIPFITKKELKSVSLVIVLGGDGTYLTAVRMLNGCRIPILGVNMGSLGFLTQVQRKNLHKTLQKTLDGKMEMRPRTMLEMKVERKGKASPIPKYTALNDIVIERGAVSQLMNASVFANDNLVNEVKADGIIIATATGSTAYNLAAGGPILQPQMKAIVVTPICPHSLTNRPIIFDEKQTLRFLIKNKWHHSFITVDGQSRGELEPGDEVIIKRSSHDHYVLRKPSDNYFDLLREKLSFGERS